MSLKERYGTRDLAYSSWHRTLPNHITYIDVDCCEYCNFCKSPLALIETAIDVGQPFKATTIMKRMAEKMNVPAYIVLYKLDQDKKLLFFNVKQIHPKYTNFFKLEISSWGKRLIDLHDRCLCRKN